MIISKNITRVWVDVALKHRRILCKFLFFHQVVLCCVVYFVRVRFSGGFWYKFSLKNFSLKLICNQENWVKGKICSFLSMGWTFFSSNFILPNTKENQRQTFEEFYRHFSIIFFPKIGCFQTLQIRTLYCSNLEWVSW